MTTMTRALLFLSTAALLAAPIVYAHDGADGVPGTPDATCETGAEWQDHDYGSDPVGGLLIGFQESNLRDCNGDGISRDDDFHSEYSRGGAWLLVDSGDGVTGGSLLCFGEEGHHPSFGPVTVADRFFLNVGFTVEADLVDETGLGDPCGDFLSDVSVTCFGTCYVPFHAGIDGSYQVYVGFGDPSSQGHVCTSGGDCSLGGFSTAGASSTVQCGNPTAEDGSFGHAATGRLAWIDVVGALREGQAHGGGCSDGSVGIRAPALDEKSRDCFLDCAFPDDGPGRVEVKDGGDPPAQPLCRATINLGSCNGPCNTVINGGFCAGQCTVNLGYCSASCKAIVNVGRC